MTGRSVAGETTHFFNEPKEFVQVVFATHQVLPYMPYALHVTNAADNVIYWYACLLHRCRQNAYLRQTWHSLPK